MGPLPCCSVVLTHRHQPCLVLTSQGCQCAEGGEGAVGRQQGGEDTCTAGDEYRYVDDKWVHIFSARGMGYVLAWGYNSQPWGKSTARCPGRRPHLMVRCCDSACAKDTVQRQSVPVAEPRRKCKVARSAVRRRFMQVHAYRYSTAWRRWCWADGVTLVYRATRTLRPHQVRFSPAKAVKERELPRQLLPVPARVRPGTAQPCGLSSYVWACCCGLGIPVRLRPPPAWR